MGTDGRQGPDPAERIIPIALKLDHVSSRVDALWRSTIKASTATDKQ